jgi:phosphoglycerate dehydrogenase-like enzyme
MTGHAIHLLRELDNVILTPHVGGSSAGLRLKSEPGLNP